MDSHPVTIFGPGRRAPHGIRHALLSDFIAVDVRIAA
jgi:hypothetical protein